MTIPQGKWLCPLVCLLCMCGGQPGVLVDIGSWPAGAVSLRVEGSLDGTPSSTPLSFAAETTQFVVYVPEGKSGQLSLVVSARDGDDCPRATGQTQLAVGSGLRSIAEVQLELSALAFPWCRAPLLQQVMPGLGPSNGGITLTLSGDNFRSGAAVEVAGYPADNVQWLNPTQLTATLPKHPGAIGLVAVTVRNPDGQPASRNDLFAYYTSQLDVAAMTTLAVGLQPRAVAVGDFNGDTYVDLVVANGSSGNVSVLLNDTQGGFGAATDTPVGPLPGAGAVADLNRDGFLDLAVATSQSNSVRILLGNGTGSFSAPANLPNIDSPQSVTLADLNGDGAPDLVVTNILFNTISVLLGNGLGGFGAITTFGVGVSPGAVAVGDFNGDGKPDLAVANFSSDGKSLSVLLGTGNGRFGAATNYDAGIDGTAVVVGDFNRDGKPDLAVTTYPSSGVSILLGDGQGTFGAATSFAVGAGPVALVLGDINGDQLLDLTTANRDDNTVSVLLGDGKGRFRPAVSFPSGPLPYWVAMGDFNHDQKPDLVTANYNGNNVSILLNRSQ